MKEEKGTSIKKRLGRKKVHESVEARIDSDQDYQA